MCRAPAARVILVFFLIVILGFDPRIHSNKAVCFFGPSGRGSLSLPPEGGKKGARVTDRGCLKIKPSKSKLKNIVLKNFL